MCYTDIDIRLPEDLSTARERVSAVPIWEGAISENDNPWLRRYALNKYAVAPDPSGSLVTPDWAAVDRGLQKIGEGIDIIRASNMDPVLIQTSCDHLEKTALQRGRAAFAHVQDGGYSYSTEYTSPVYGWLADRLASVASPLDIAGLTYPTNTNHGFPSYRKDDADLAAHSAIASVFLGSGCEAAGDVIGYMAELHRNPLPESSTYFTRTGPSRKYAKMWETVAGTKEVRVSREIKGVVCRTRDVKGVSSYRNIILAPIAKLELAAMARAFPGTFDRTTADDDARTLRTMIEHAPAVWVAFGLPMPTGWDTAEQDQGAFDQHVAYESIHFGVRRVHLAIAEKAIRAAAGGDAYALLKPEELERFITEIEDLPVLIPGLTAEDDVVAVLPKRGQTTSGLRTTTVEGSIHSIVAFVEGMAAGYGLPLYKAWLMFCAGAFPFLCWGDDVVFAYHSGFDSDAYLQRMVDLGYDVSFIKGGSIFLMKALRNVLPGQGRPYAHGLAARAEMQTLFREHGTLELAVEIIGAAARWDACANDPNVEALYALTVKGTVLERYSYAQMRQIAKNPAALLHAHGVKRDDTSLRKLLDVLAYANALDAHRLKAILNYAASTTTTMFNLRTKMSVPVARRIIERAAYVR